MSFIAYPRRKMLEDEIFDTQISKHVAVARFSQFVNVQ
jgi:hypothetical protein